MNDEYLRDFRWRSMANNRFNYLDIGDDLVMKEGLNSGRYDVWSSLFPLNTRRFGRNTTLLRDDDDIDDIDDTDEALA